MRIIITDTSWNIFNALIPMSSVTIKSSCWLSGVRKDFAMVALKGPRYNGIICDDTSVRSWYFRATNSYMRKRMKEKNI